MDAKIIEILEKNDKYCSHGDTVNYADPPKVFEGCEFDWGGFVGAFGSNSL